VNNRSKPFALPGWINPVLLVLASLVFFAAFSNRFPSGDSLFHLGHRVTDPGSLLEALTGKTDIHYRPLSNNLACGLLYGFLGIGFTGLNITAGLLHLLNALLLYVLLVRINLGRLPGLLAAFFFLTHYNVKQIIWGVAYFPELLMTLFFLGAFHALLSYLKKPRLRQAALIAALVVAAFGCKETAIVLPVILLVGYVCLNRPNFCLRDQAFLGLVILLFVLTAAHLTFLLSLDLGTFYAPYHLAWDPWLAAKNLVVYLQRIATSNEVLQWPGLFLLIGLILAAFARRIRTALLALFWIPAALGPVLLMQTLGNWYLYLPLVGSSILMAAGLHSISAGGSGQSPIRYIYPAACLLVLLAAGLNYSIPFRELTRSDPVSARRWKAYDRLRELCTRRNDVEWLYVLRNPSHPLFFETGQGGLFNVACGIPLDCVQFAETGARLAMHFRSDPSILVVGMTKAGEVFDVTGPLGREASERKPPNPLQLGPLELARQSEKGEELLFIRMAGCEGRELGIRFRAAGGAEETAVPWVSLDENGSRTISLDERVAPVKLHIIGYQCIEWEEFRRQGVRFQFRLDRGDHEWIPIQAEIRLR